MAQVSTSAIELTSLPQPLPSFTPNDFSSSSRDATRDNSIHRASGVRSNGPPTPAPTTEEDGIPRDASEHERQISSLPPVDGGKDAWLFLAACFAIEALVWGFPFAFGIFQSYYSTHAPFAGEPNIAVIGTCAMGIMYLTAPLILGTMRMFGRWTRYMPLVGLGVMCVALALSSFSQNVWQLIVTQGVMYAVGGGLAYCPCILYMDEWFVSRRGLAYGIMWSGTGLAGVILPVVMQSLLDSLGFRSTLRLWSGLLFLLTAPLSYYIKPRLPLSATAHVRPFDMRFMKMSGFWMYQIANVVEALGFFLPGIYLPTYAKAAFGGNDEEGGGLVGAITVLLLNVASVFGCIAMGYFTDRLHVTSCIMLSTVGATLGVFLLWGLSVNLPMLYAFCVIYGLFAGSFTSCWPGIMKDVIHKGDGREDQYGVIDPSMVFGWLAAGRGVGNVVSGPLSDVLARDLPWKGEAGYGFGSGYGSLIVFTGVTAMLGGGSWVWRRLGLL